MMNFVGVMAKLLMAQTLALRQQLTLQCLEDCLLFHHVTEHQMHLPVGPSPRSWPHRKKHKCLRLDS
jgi:hypothetical protein